MKISIISFTKQGSRLANQIKSILSDDETEVFYKPKQGVYRWTGEQFAKSRAILFIGACGIAVRAIAPYLKDKLTDAAVLVLDEKGQFVIPILSGHLGGANELAKLLADGLQATAVITTATDLYDKFAIDLFAKKNGFQILNKDGIAKVSAKVLREEPILFWIEGGESRLEEGREAIPSNIKLVSNLCLQKADVLIASDADKDIWQDKTVLRLKPKEYIIGIGCRKGKTGEEITEFALKNLQNNGILDSEIAAVASIEKKKQEIGICQFAEKISVPFVTFPKEYLLAIEGEFCASAFVKQTVGVDNVCERAAIAACMGMGELILKKQAENGMTLAIAKRIWNIRWEW